jgi:hypothetical protein
MSVTTNVTDENLRDENLRRLVEHVVAAMQPIEVWLFGSRVSPPTWLGTTSTEITGDPGTRARSGVATRGLAILRGGWNE